jgi:hypothetical protein
VLVLCAAVGQIMCYFFGEMFNFFNKEEDAEGANYDVVVSRQDHNPTITL